MEGYKRGHKPAQPAADVYIYYLSNSIETKKTKN